jgi:hypothetical protein
VELSRAPVLVNESAAGFASSTAGHELDGSGSTFYAILEAYQSFQREEA